MKYRKFYFSDSEEKFARPISDPKARIDLTRVVISVSASGARSFILRRMPMSDRSRRLKGGLRLLAKTVAQCENKNIMLYLISKKIWNLDIFICMLGIELI